MKFEKNDIIHFEITIEISEFKKTVRGLAKIIEVDMNAKTIRVFQFPKRSTIPLVLGFDQIGRNLGKISYLEVMEKFPELII